MTDDIRRLQADIADRNVPVTALLQRAIALADTLGDQEFVAWARQELNGYGREDEEIKYRFLKGEYVVCASDGRSSPIDWGTRPSPGSRRFITLPLPELESLNAPGADSYAVRLPDATGAIRNLKPGDSVAFQVGRATFLGFLGAVRNRILEWTLGAAVSAQNGAANMRRIGVMIGSPSDASEERQAITDVILRWNAVNRDRGIFVDPVKWETHATPGLQGRPQGMINAELVPISDILVAVFRSRAGSPTGKELSGTIEEIREFMRLGKYVVLYFYEGEVAIGKVDPDQLKTINEFRKEIQLHGLTASYKNINELREHIICHLTSIVGKLPAPAGGRSPSEEVGGIVRQPEDHASHFEQAGQSRQRNGSRMAAGNRAPEIRSKFETQVRDGAFHGLTRRKGAIAIAVIPTLGKEYEAHELRRQNLAPPGKSSWNTEIRGKWVLSAATRGDERCAIVAFHNDGIILAATTWVLDPEFHPVKDLVVPAEATESVIITAVARYLEALRAMEAVLPWQICVSLLEIRDYWLLVSNSETSPRPYPEADIAPDALVVRSLSEVDSPMKIARLLRPALNFIWREFGLEGCYNYTATGDYSGRLFP